MYYGYLRISVFLFSIFAVSSRTINSESESDSLKEVFHPLTLQIRGESRHKRNVECSSLSCRSLCPWTWVHDSKDGRVPHSISRAVCLNQTCDFDFIGLGHRTRRRLQFLTECELVYTDIRVWQDDSPTWIPWPIACACSRARSSAMMRLGNGVVISEFNRQISRQATAGMF